jgi:hypothetical protein
MSQQQIRISGIEVLSQHLGVTGMIRFLQQTDIGSGDYTHDRKQIIGNPELEQLMSEISKANY